MNTKTATEPKKTETDVANLPAKQASLIETMAAKYSMAPTQFASTIRKTAMPANATVEEFAAFLMIAHEYKLNPLLKEIYAFPKKGGGIAPMVSIDGWVNIINSNDKLEGFEFEFEHDDKGALISCTCTMKRNDRTMPTKVTEYLAECVRNTDPWKMKYRMLRHKALIQAARYCFGLSGIYDEDEARDQAMIDVTPQTARPKVEDFLKPGPYQASEPEDVDPETGEVIEQDSAAQAATLKQQDGAAPEAGSSSPDTSGADDKAVEKSDAKMIEDIGFEHAKDGRSLRAMPAVYRDNEEASEAYKRGHARYKPAEGKA